MPLSIKIFIPILLCAVLFGCGSTSNDYRIDAYRVRNATAWTPDFRTSNDTSSGIAVHVLMPTLTHEDKLMPGDRYPYTSDTVGMIIGAIGITAFPYPIDTTVHKNPPREGGVFGPYSEYSLSFHQTPIIFTGGRRHDLTGGIAPVRVDKIDGGIFYFPLQPGTYLIQAGGMTWEPVPHVTKDVIVQRGRYSVVTIGTTGPLIY